MKKALFALLVGLSFAGTVYAACSTHTIMVNGRMVTCTTCCFNGNCTTNCF